MSKIELPTVLTEDTRFYKKNKKVCMPHLGKPYLSYSTKSSWDNPKYKNSLIRTKIIGLPRESNIYGDFGTFIGKCIEENKVVENPMGFIGLNNLKHAHRPDNAEFERFVLIDRGEYVIIGFIDMSLFEKDGVTLCDYKTGGKDKEQQYYSEDYFQIPLYAAALEEEGYKIKDSFVWFMRRSGSHFKPPLKLTSEQFMIDSKYDSKIRDKTLKEMDKTAKEISDFYKTFKKIFK